MSLQTCGESTGCAVANLKIMGITPAGVAFFDCAVCGGIWSMGTTPGIVEFQRTETLTELAANHYEDATT